MAESGAGRRDFLRLGFSTASFGLLPPAIRRALALPAPRRTGSIEDVEHIIVFMQENRSFDHYFGHLSGVRGYNDRHPVLRADKRSVWNQPRRNDADSIVLPFHLPTKATSAECVLDLNHSWYPTQRALAAGRNDRWPANKTDLTMGYYLREDIPFHYALADAFTICDNYFCSTPTETHPNRMYLMTGMVDPSGSGGGPPTSTARTGRASIRQSTGWLHRLPSGRRLCRVRDALWAGASHRGGVLGALPAEVP